MNQRTNMQSPSESSADSLGVNPKANEKSRPQGATALKAEDLLLAIKESKFQKRFNKKVKPNNVTDCLEWTGKLDWQGYGRVYLVSSNLLVHRASWIMNNGLIPEGICVCHRCDNPPCVNPAHLFLGTRAENNADMLSKGRGADPKKRVETIRNRYAARTHCKHGHEFTPENSAYHKHGDRTPGRVCRQCYRLKSARVAALKNSKMPEVFQ